jgi:hypothetical protein
VVVVAGADNVEGGRWRRAGDVLVRLVAPTPRTTLESTREATRWVCDGGR